MSQEQEDYLLTVAKTAYDAVALYSADVLQQHPVSFWVDLNQKKQESILNTVKDIAKGKITTISWLHQYWIDAMREDNWSYGAYYSESEKVHPNLVNAAYVEPQEMTKYFLFYFTIQSLFIQDEFSYVDREQTTSTLITD